MSRIITEDIINKAINESIDEFMLEEGFGDTLKDWGQKVKGWGQDFDNKYGNRFSKTWNGLKNGIKMYMDYRTNGQWNREYNSYAKGNSKNVEMYYFNKWLNFHLDEIKSISYYMQNPNRAQGEIEWSYDENGKKVGKQKVNNYSNIRDYVIKNLTPINFNTWIKNYLKDRKALRYIDDYITNYCSKINDMNSASQILNIRNFYNTRDGKKYLEAKNGDLTNQRNQYQVQNDKNGAIELFKYLHDNSGQITVQQLYNNIDNLGDNFNISNDRYVYIKQYLLRIYKNVDSNQTINFGKRYNYLTFNAFYKSNKNFFN